MLWNHSSPAKSRNRPLRLSAFCLETLSLKIRWTALGDNYSDNTRSPQANSDLLPGLVSWAFAQALCLEGSTLGFLFCYHHLEIPHNFWTRGSDWCIILHQSDPANYVASPACHLTPKATPTNWFLPPLPSAIMGGKVNKMRKFYFRNSQVWPSPEPSFKTTQLNFQKAQPLNLHFRRSPWVILFFFFKFLIHFYC